MSFRYHLHGQRFPLRVWSFRSFHWGVRLWWFRVHENLSRLSGFALLWWRGFIPTGAVPQNNKNIQLFFWVLEFENNHKEINFIETDRNKYQKLRIIIKIQSEFRCFLCKIGGLPLLIFVKILKFSSEKVNEVLQIGPGLGGGKGFLDCLSRETSRGSPFNDVRFSCREWNWMDLHQLPLPTKIKRIQMDKRME